MIVNKQKPIEFINDCNCLVDLKELEKAILWYTEKPVTRLKKIYLHGRYPAVSIHSQKIHVHRILMMYWKNRRLEFKEHVHHKDENRLNAHKNNLEIIEGSKHLSQHNKGRKLSAEHRMKIGEKNKLRKGVKVKRQYEIPEKELSAFLKEGKSINFISQHYGCDRGVIKNRIHEHPHLLGGVDK